MACQLRFSTSTVALFKMSLIKCFHPGTAIRPVRCLIFVETTQGLEAYRQCNQSQISAAKGINASAHLTWNDGLAVL